MNSSDTHRDDALTKYDEVYANFADEAFINHRPDVAGDCSGISASLARLLALDSTKDNEVVSKLREKL